ncbi:MAG: hypothetical protein CBARDCOR_6391 [uncultured Caballeronia sp.]|nr:MAG: hypothetical protein CBARDCOR_6391 [uncultured Caballeronia sp.]
MNPFAYSGYQAMADLTLPVRHDAALVNHALDAWPAVSRRYPSRPVTASRVRSADTLGAHA